MSPFEVLGLENDASLREVKRAYAKLLKQHRPDKDPEGFVRIQEAYQNCLRSVELRDASGRTAERSSPALSRLEPAPAKTLSNHAMDPWEGVDPEDRSAVCERITERISQALQGQISPATLSPYLAEDLERAWQVEAILGVPFELLVTVLQNRDLDLLTSCLRICQQGGDFSLSLRIAWYWLELMNGSSVEELLPLGWGLAPVLSVAYPNLSENIMGHLFTHDTRARREGGSAYDDLIMLGRILQPLPEDQKLHWSRLLFSEQEPDWFSPVHRSCLDSLARLPQGAVAMRILLSYLGEESGLNPEQAVPLEEELPVEKKFFFEGGCGTCMVIAVILLFLGTLVSCSNGGFFFLLDSVFLSALDIDEETLLEEIPLLLEGFQEGLSEQEREEFRKLIEDMDGMSSEEFERRIRELEADT